MKFFSSKYYISLIAFCISISALPVIFIGTFSYKWSSDIVQRKVNAGNLQVLKQSQIRVEQALKVIDNSVLQFVISRLVSSASGRKLVLDDFRTINDLGDALNHLDTGEIKIHESALVSMNYRWVISKSHFINLADYGRSEQLKEYAAANKNSFWIGDNKFKSNSGKNPDKENYGANLVRKLVPFGSMGTPDFVVIKVLSSEIEKLISDTQQLGDVIILDEQHNVVVDRNNQMAGRDPALVSYVKTIDRNGTGSGQFDAMLEGRKYAVTFIRSEYNGWTYISCVPIESITREARSIGWVTLFTCVGIFLVIAFVIYYGSRRIYSPVKNLYDTLRNVFHEEEHKKQTDEFAYIDERVKNLMTTQTQMSENLKSQVEQLKELFVIKLLQGEILEDEISDKLELFRYPKQWTWLCVFVLEVDTLEGTPFYEKDRDLVMFAIKNLISELVPVEQRLSPVLLKESQITVVGSNHPTYEAFISFAMSQAEMIQNAIREYLSVSVSIGISHPYNRFGEAYKAYKEGEEALRYKLRSSAESVIYIDDVQTENVMKSRFPNDLMDELIYAVKQADAKRAETMLHRFMEIIFNDNLSYPEYQVTMCRLFSELTGVLQDMGEPLQNLYGDQKSLLDKLFELKTPQLVESWMANTILRPTVKMMEEHTKLQYQKISDRVIEMIRSEYDKELTLGLCAERLNYNPNYVSKVFREETGVNFSEYLASERLKAAKKLLKETDMKISEIADRLQYKNAENFIRYFKKLEGVTPGQYREQK